METNKTSKKQYYKASDHTFVICAYGESRYIEECIKSLQSQSLKSNICMTTSTPNEFLKAISKKYGIELVVNKELEGNSNIASDWNFAVSCAKTPLVTIAHQDDVYKENYTLKILENANKARKPLIIFTDYGELRDGIEVVDNKLLNIKRIMLFPLRAKVLWHSIFVRRRILSIGSPICCPSVTYVPANLPKELFIPGYLGGIDWQAWERFSRLKGDFVFINEILMLHRIHVESATTSIIKGHQRSEEDYDMFCKFWPKWFARIIAHYYRKGESQNEL
ncbi:Glycosyltransferase involved in cell wall bisynthesis [Butyrivibrio proteoclasticus]|uniref:Glycosyltransferase involved in cell wall bisynthesis n=1 Tax=Butyrivibrio proteoclasticus TaxID=43305 RepID=A0A1I5PUM3_9FIRM|nr:glycosyltransferase family 2 protein [Butyrivibrio proteoclasticus]SFP37679.1 Glycosyltransferase involved in cell wall bisynthesis [Butyrivibrio proteoclasticus]